MSSNTYPVFFDPAFLSDSNAGIWTMPSTAASSTILQELTLKLHNRTSATRLVTIYAFDGSATAGSSNEVCYELPVPPKDYVLVPVHRIAGANAAIQGYCDVANSVTVAPIGGKLHVP